MFSWFMCSRMASPSTYSKLMLAVFGSRSCGWPFNSALGTEVSSPCSSLSRRARTRVFSSSILAAASSQARPRPMIEATFSVPPRRPRSWWPPFMKGTNGVPLRT